MDTFAELIRAARTCRRFAAEKPLPEGFLRKMVDTVRLTSSCSNRQPLRYITVTRPETRAAVFPHIKWAAAIQWEGPAEDERPTGYVAICSVQEPALFVYYDTAIAAQTMQLYAADMGIGCCMINNFSRPGLREALAVPEAIEPMLVLAFGYPREERRLVEAKPGDSLKYWRDGNNVHYVPKLTLDQVLLGEK